MSKVCTPQKKVKALKGCKAGGFCLQCKIIPCGGKIPCSQCTVPHCPYPTPKCDLGNKTEDDDE